MKPVNESPRLSAARQAASGNATSSELSGTNLSGNCRKNRSGGINLFIFSSQD
jgi:hypothetical protein